MKRLLSFLIVAGCIISAQAQVTTNSVEPAPSYSTFVPPGAGASYVDPVFGSTIKRLTNANAMANADRGGNLTWIENEYSTMSPFNSDNSRCILLHESYFGLYDGDGAFLYSLPLEINASSEPRWSRSNNAVLYFHSGNSLKSYNVTTSAMVVMHQFSEYTAVSGTGESDISTDGDHFVFVGDNREIFVYEISTGKKYPTFDTAGNNLDSAYITPDNHVIVSWIASGSSRFTGQELFDINMGFLRQISHADGHKDVTRDTNGDEVLIWTNSDDPQPIANCQNGIVKIRLADAQQTCLLQLDWSLAVHISAPDGNGTVFVDTEAPGNPQPGTPAWVPYTNELLQVKLDGSGTTRLAQHRSFPVNGYNWQPKLAINRDGTRLVYASNFDLAKLDGYNSEYSDTYLIVLGQSGAPISTGTGTTPPTVVRYEQDDKSVQMTGTWYPNSGSFNSGGSASLAMDVASKAAFTFTGTGVKWIGFSDAWSGIAQVFVDGALVATVDTYAANQSAQAAEYSLDGLSSGQHVLTIAVTGTHSAQSGGAWVWVDAFDVMTAAPPSGTAVPSSMAHSNGQLFVAHRR